jgi:hypothetical protein
VYGNAYRTWYRSVQMAVRSLMTSCNVVYFDPIALRALSSLRNNVFYLSLAPCYLSYFYCLNISVVQIGSGLYKMRVRTKSSLFRSVYEQPYTDTTRWKLYNSTKGQYLIKITIICLQYGMSVVNNTPTVIKLMLHTVHIIPEKRIL